MDAITAVVVTFVLTSTYEFLKGRFGRRDYLQRAVVLLDIESKLKDRNDETLDRYADQALWEAKEMLDKHNEISFWPLSLLKGWLLIACSWMLFMSIDRIYSTALNMLAPLGNIGDSTRSTIALTLVVGLFLVTFAVVPRISEILVFVYRVVGDIVRRIRGPLHKRR